MSVLHKDEQDLNTTEEMETEEEELFSEHKINFSEVYEKEGAPDFLNHKIIRAESFEDTEKTRIENDSYLFGFNPLVLVGKSIKFLEQQYEDFEVKSGFKKSDCDYEEFVTLHQPQHGHTEGGKGLTFYTRPVAYQFATMSSMNNLNISYGCYPLHNEVNFLQSINGVKIAINAVFAYQTKIPIQTPIGIFSSIKSIIFNGFDEVFEYTDEEGQVYQCTANHPFMSEVDGVLRIEHIRTIFKQGLPILKVKEDDYDTDK